MIGIRESRCRHVSTRTTGDHWVAPSPARENGSCGVEMWVADSLLSTRDRILIEVVSVDPRRLLVRLALQDQLLAVFVAHAPDKGRGADEQHARAATAQLLRHARIAGLPLLVLMQLGCPPLCGLAHTLRGNRPLVPLSAIGAITWRSLPAGPV